MQPAPASSESGDGDLDAVALAVLVACHHRGPLGAAELALLLPGQTISALVLETLTQRRLLDVCGQTFTITQPGRDYLDGVLEGIEARLAPDDPAYVRRYRRETPTLPFAANTI